MMLTYETHGAVSDSKGRLPWGRVITTWAQRQLGAELFGMPGYRLSLGGETPPGFVLSPHEARPINVQSAKALMSARFNFAGGRMSVQGSGDPWNRPSPNRAFAVELHRFSWLNDMVSVGDAGAKEGLRLFLLWYKTFRAWTPFAWGLEVLPRRLINLAIHARRLAMGASLEARVTLSQSIAEQTRHLTRLSDRGGEYAAIKAITLIIVGAVLEGKVGESLFARGMKRLPGALKKTVMPDGAHMSRSPAQSLDLLYDLLIVEDVLGQKSIALPDYLLSTIEKLARFVRALCHPDGSLCAFQGSESIPAFEIAPALARDEGRIRVGSNELPQSLEHGRYQRLIGRSLMVFVDVGEARTGRFSASACDHPLSFEVSGGRDKLIVGSGWSPLQCERHALRIVGAANSLTLGEGLILNPVTGRFAELLSFGLEGPKYKTRSRRIDSDGAGTLLELEHDGWKPFYGVRHERRLYVDPGRDELRGEDKLVPIETKTDSPRGVPFAVRFTLHPEVQASLARDKKSVLLKAPGGRGWWFRHDAREIMLENATVFDRGQPRKTQAIAVKGVCRLEGQSRVRWKLSPAEG